MDHTIRTVREIARAAGELLQACRPDGKRADREADEFWRLSLEQAFPASQVITEETFAQSQLDTARSGAVWFVDPLDATASYARGKDCYATMAALVQDGRLVMGLVHHPPTATTYHAVAGGGAFANGVRLRVSSRRRLEEMRLVHRHTMTNNLRAIIDALPCAEKTVSGSLGLKLCRIAEGSYDVTVYDTSPNLWDILPGALILQEAGGKLTDLLGRDVTLEAPRPKGILATNGTIHQQLLKRIQPLSFVIREPDK